MDTNTPGAGPQTPPTPPTPPAPGPVTPQKNTGMAILAYLGILVIVPLVTEAKNDPFVKFHIRQGLLVLIGFVVSGIITWVPVLGWGIGSLIWIASLVLMIIGIMNAADGKEEKLPLVGHLGDNFHI